MFKAPLTALNLCILLVSLFHTSAVHGETCQHALEQLSQIPQESSERSAVRRFYFERNPEWVSGQRIRPIQKGTYRNHEILIFHELAPLSDGHRRLVAALGPAIFEVREIPPNTRFSVEKLDLRREELKAHGIRTIRIFGEFEMNNRQYLMGENFPRISEAQLRSGSSSLGLNFQQIRKALDDHRLFLEKLEELGIDDRGLRLSFDGHQWLIETPASWGAN